MKKRNQALEKSQTMIVNKSNYDLSHSDKLLLTKGLNFAPTPRWTPKMEREEWYNAQKHIRNVEWHDVFGDGNDDEIKRKVPDKLKASKLFPT